QGAVWRLANCGYTVDDIERTLAAHPNGIAKKYEGRLRKEIERSYGKWKHQAGSPALPIPIHLTVRTTALAMSWLGHALTRTIGTIPMSPCSTTGEVSCQIFQ